MNIRKAVTSRELELLSKARSRESLLAMSETEIKQARCRHTQSEAKVGNPGGFNPASNHYPCVHICDVCGKGFTSKGLVNKHSLKELDKAVTVISDFLNSMKMYSIFSIEGLVDDSMVKNVDREALFSQIVGTIPFIERLPEIYVLLNLAETSQSFPNNIQPQYNTTPDRFHGWGTIPAIIDPAFYDKELSIKESEKDDKSVSEDDNFNVPESEFTDEALRVIKRNSSAFIKDGNVDAVSLINHLFSSVKFGYERYADSVEKETGSDKAEDAASDKTVGSSNKAKYELTPQSIEYIKKHWPEAINEDGSVDYNKFVINMADVFDKLNRPKEDKHPAADF